MLNKKCFARNSLRKHAPDFLGGDFGRRKTREISFGFFEKIYIFEKIYYFLRKYFFEIFVCFLNSGTVEKHFLKKIFKEHFNRGPPLGTTLCNGTLCGGDRQKCVLNKIVV